MLRDREREGQNCAENEFGIFALAHLHDPSFGVLIYAIFPTTEVKMWIVWLTKSAAGGSVNARYAH